MKPQKIPTQTHWFLKLLDDHQWIPAVVAVCGLIIVNGNW